MHLVRNWLISFVSLICAINATTTTTTMAASTGSVQLNLSIQSFSISISASISTSTSAATLTASLVSREFWRFPRTERVLPTPAILDMHTNTYMYEHSEGAAAADGGGMSPLPAQLIVNICKRRRANKFVCCVLRFLWLLLLFFFLFFFPCFAYLPQFAGYVCRSRCVGYARRRLLVIPEHYAY